MSEDVRKLVLPSGTYLIAYADASVALRAGAKLAKVLGPAFSKAGDLEGALSAVLASDDLEGLLDYLGQTFARSTQLVLSDGARTTSHTLADVYEVHFRGKLGDLIKWLVAAVGHNLASFFEGLPSVVADARDAAKAPA